MAKSAPNTHTKVRFERATGPGVVKGFLVIPSSTGHSSLAYNPSQLESYTATVPIVPSPRHAESRPIFVLDLSSPTDAFKPLSWRETAIHRLPAPILDRSATPWF
jgi:hypothetical protein